MKNSAGLFVKIIITQKLPAENYYQKANRHTGGKSGNANKRIKFIFKYIAKSYFNVVFDNTSPNFSF